MDICGAVLNIVNYLDNVELCFVKYTFVQKFWVSKFVFLNNTFSLRMH